MRLGFVRNPNAEPNQSIPLTTPQDGTVTSVHLTLMTAVMSCAVASLPVSVDAQQTTPEPHGFLSINAGVRVTSNDFTDNVRFTLFVEEGDFNAHYQFGTVPVFDIQGGVPIWRNLALGCAVSVFNKGATASISARLPHPFFLIETGPCLALQRILLEVRSPSIFRHCG